MTDTDLEDDVLKWPIELLDLSTRARNCIMYVAGAKTVGDIVGKTRQELLKIRSFGEIFLAEVERKLALLGLRLGMRTEEKAPLPWQQIVARLTAERDEARREICSTVVFPSSPQEYANRRGWDCFKEDGK
jgi:hypothetical protein